jgi:hypothetical protein
MCDDRQHEVWGGIGHANGDPEVIGNGDPEVILHKNKQPYPPLVIVPGMLLPQLLSDVFPQPRIAQTKQGHIDWPIDPALEQMDLQVGALPHMNIPVYQHDPNNMVVQPVHQSLPNASIQLGDPANLGIPRDAESVMNGAVHQGGPVTQGLQHASPSSLNTSLQQGGAATQGFQQASLSVQNMPLKQGGPAS